MICKTSVLLFIENSESTFERPKYFPVIDADFWEKTPWGEANSVLSLLAWLAWST